MIGRAAIVAAGLATLGTGAAWGVNIDTETTLVHAAIRINADALSGGAMHVLVRLREAIAVLSFFGLFGIAMRGYIGGGQQGFDFGALTGILSAMCLLGLAAAAAGFFIAEDPNAFDLEAISEELHKHDRGVTYHELR